MCYTNYNEWVIYVENKFAEYSESRHCFGFKNWIEDLVSTNATIKRDFDEFVIYRQNEEEPNYYPKKIHPKSGKPMYNPDNDYPDFIAKVISHAFYDDRIPNDKFGHKEHRRIKELYHDRKNDSPWTNIRNYCLAQNQIQLDIANINPYCSWVVICSAFQKRYGIFSSLDDLNNFVFSVGQASVFSNYGFYMRDLTHICLAYAIMHGYSINEEKLLLQRAIEAVGCAHSEVSREERSANNTYTEDARGVFGKWFKINQDQVMSFKSGDNYENDFIKVLVDNSRYIIMNIADYNHWSALKIALNTLFEVNDSDDDAEVIGYGFMDRLLALYEEFVGLQEINIWELCGYLKKGSLQEQIIKSLSIDKIADVDKKYMKRLDAQVKVSVKKDRAKIDSEKIAEFQTENMYEIELKQEDAKVIIANSLRYIYIVALMKQIRNKESCETAMAVIGQVNERLAEAGMRDIEDFSKIGNNAVPIDMPKDFVDGFIVECICYEEKRRFDVVSGFDTFMRYLLKRT